MPQNITSLHCIFQTFARQFGMSSQSGKRFFQPCWCGWHLPLCSEPRCRVLPMHSSECIERDNSGTVRWAQLLHSEGHFADWLFSHVCKKAFLWRRKTSVWVWMKVLWVNYLILKPRYTAWEIRLQTDKRHFLELCLSLNTWEQKEKIAKLLCLIGFW